MPPILPTPRAPSVIYSCPVRGLYGSFKPAEYYQVETSAEVLMWLTCLIDGIRSACNDDADDMEWLMSDEYYTGSFTHTCNAVDIDHIELRERVLYDKENIRKRRYLNKSIIVRGALHDFKGTKGDTRASRASEASKKGRSTKGEAS